MIVKSSIYRFLSAISKSKSCESLFLYFLIARGLSKAAVRLQAHTAVQDPKLQKLADQFRSEPVLVNYEGNAARC